MEYNRINYANPSSSTSTRKYVEPCGISPTADLNAPQPDRDWEFPANRELLWEQEIHRTNGGDSRRVGWLSVYWACDGTSDDKNYEEPCRFMAVFNDSVARNKHENLGWLHDITASPLGQFIIGGWAAQNGEKFATLPKNYQEWREKNRRDALAGFADELTKEGIEVTGLTDGEIFSRWQQMKNEQYVKHDAELGME